MLGLIAAIALQAGDVPEGVERSLEVRERNCAYIYETKDGMFGWESAPDMRVIVIISNYDEFSFPLPDNTVSILCARNTPVPHPADYKVLNAGYDLTIAVYDGRRTELNYEDGAAVFAMAEGQLTEEERDWADDIVEQMQEHVRPRPAD